MCGCQQKYRISEGEGGAKEEGACPLHLRGGKNCQIALSKSNFKVLLAIKALKAIALGQFQFLFPPKILRHTGFFLQRNLIDFLTFFRKTINFFSYCDLCNVIAIFLFFFYEGKERSVGSC